MSITFYCPDASDKELDRIGCNFANGNAFDVLRLIGRFNEDDPYYGVWEVNDLPLVQRSIIKALNIDQARACLVRAPRNDSRLIYQGNTDEQTIRRLTALRELVTFASKHRYKVVFS